MEGDSFEACEPWGAPGRMFMMFGNRKCLKGGAKIKLFCMHEAMYPSGDIRERYPSAVNIMISKVGPLQQIPNLTTSECTLLEEVNFD
ncbi:hypothetical protein KIN20_003134 [Parelaphostrongylus tenuis]|uniref:Uncharacterized protein n=1 Tax=Parelaphostrongylus tenuis TaxID=148309 RepID=A0AAD5MF82_PARTN|nr:hypothetical protein KIN20_003134 [Parelaphostrongylus tenuis]